MIVKEVEGDLIADFLDVSHDNFDSIAHGCNCFHAMSSGIAGQVTEHIYPAVTVDRLTEHGSMGKLGKFSRVRVELGTPMYHIHREVFNLYTQFYPGKDARYSAVYNAFVALNEHVKDRSKRHRVAIPLIGSGIGGLTWDRVKEIIEYTTPDVDIIVYHYKPKGK